MSSAPRPSELQRGAFREGEPIIIVEPEGQKHFVVLRPGDKFHHIRTGHIPHDRMIGKPPGCRLLSNLGVPVICVRPTLEDYIFRRLKRRTSIIHPKDLAPLLVRGDLFPGARVAEIGIGSGATTIFLLRHIGPDGYLVSYERRPEFIENAVANVREFSRLYGDPGTVHQVIERDVYLEGIDPGDFDLVMVDVPEPFRITDSAWEALRPGGTLLSWLPTVLQVYTLARQLQEDSKWEGVEARELLERSWEIAENAIRPYHRMVAHTGFLVRSRKLVIDPWKPEVTTELPTAPSSPVPSSNEENPDEAPSGGNDLEGPDPLG